MFWVALWFLLLIGAAVVLGLIAWSVWGKAVALMHEMGEAGERFAALAPQGADADRGAAAAAADLAVFADPLELRRQHDRGRRRGPRPRRGEPGSGAARHRAASGGGRSRPGRARAT